MHFVSLSICGSPEFQVKHGRECILGCAKPPRAGFTKSFLSGQRRVAHVGPSFAGLSWAGCDRLGLGFHMIPHEASLQIA